MLLQGGAIVVAAAYKAALRLTTLLLARGVGTIRPSGLERAPLLLSALLPPSKAVLGGSLHCWISNYANHLRKI